MHFKSFLGQTILLFFSLFVSKKLLFIAYIIIERVNVKHRIKFTKKIARLDCDIIIHMNEFVSQQTFNAFIR